MLLRVGALLIYMAAVILTVWIPEHFSADLRFISIGIDIFAILLLGFFPSGMSPAVFLTDDEVQNAVYCDAVEWDNLWYNSTIEDIVVTQADVIYMGGSKETVHQKALYSGHFRSDPTNQPYDILLNKYSTVYDYSFYKENNPDLAASLGDNQWKYLEHFINSGMKEGRQGNAEFNLAAYKANNPDLVAMFGDDNAKYYEHYIAGGKAEGRKAA